MEQAPDNDNLPNGLDWELDGPDAQGKVWLAGTGPKAEVRMLGNYETVATYVAEWLAQNDFGERG